MYTEPLAPSPESIPGTMLDVIPPFIDEKQPKPSKSFATKKASFQEINIITIIEPNWLPRKLSNLERLEELTTSVQQKGVIVPILVRPARTDSAHDLYELVAGKERLKAARRIGLETMPAVVRDLSDQDARLHALLDNALRHDLGPLEETESIITLVSTTLNEPEADVIRLLRNIGKNVRKVGNNVVPQKWETVLGIFSALGKNIGSFRSHSLPMLDWPLDVKDAVRSQQIAVSKGRIIARVEDENERKQMLNQAIEEGMTVEQIKRIRREKDGGPAAELCAQDLKAKAETTWTALKKSTVWDCAEKKEKLAGLLRQINRLMTETTDAA